MESVPAEGARWGEKARDDLRDDERWGVADHNGYRTGGHPDRRSGSHKDDAIDAVSCSGGRARVVVSNETGRKLELNPPLGPSGALARERKVKILLTWTVYDCIEIRSSELGARTVRRAANCAHTAEGLTASTRRGTAPFCGSTTVCFFRGM